MSLSDPSGTSEEHDTLNRDGFFNGNIALPISFAKRVLIGVDLSTVKLQSFDGIPIVH